MVFKLLKLVFIAALLFVNGWILYLFYAPNNPHHLKYVPKNADLVFSINTKQLSSELIHAALFERDQFLKLLEQEEGEESFLEGKLDNGLGLLGRMTLLYFPDSSSGENITCFLLDVNDPERFSAFIEEQGYTVEKNEEGISISNWSEEDIDDANRSGALVVFNDEVAAISSDKGEHVLPGLENLISKGAKGENEFATGLVGDFHDFSVYGSMNDPEKILAAFLSDIRLTGDFTEESIELGITTTLKDESNVKGNFFNEHKYATGVDDYLKEGFLNMHFDVHTAKIFNIIIEKTILGKGRSINRAIFKELSKNLGNKIMIRCDEIKAIPNNDTSGKYDAYPLKNAIAIMIPMVEIEAEVNDRLFIHQALEHFTGDSLPMEKDGEFYVFKSDFNTNYYIHLSDDVLTISYTKKKGTGLAEQFDEYSNWIWYDLSGALESITPEGNYLFQTIISGGADVMNEGIPFDNMYFYSTGEEKGKVNWEGKIFFKSKENHTLIEFIRYIPNMMETVL